MAKKNKKDDLEAIDSSIATENLVDEAPITSSEEEVEREPRVRSGVFGLVAIFSSLVLAAVALLAPFEENSKFTLAADRTVNISFTLVSGEFIRSGMLNPCGGVGSIKGISSSTLTVSKGSWREDLRIGSGTLNENGDCVYTLKANPPESFIGGEIELSARFPFGISSTYKVDIGDEIPWSIARLSLPLE